MRLNVHIGGGSHLPILMKVMEMTDGSVLELGMGMFSTPYLHWACYGKQRRLLSCETHKDFLGMFKFDDPREKANSYGFHEFILVEKKNWDAIDISEHWSVVLIDHHPGPRRREEMKRLAHNADYIIVHDTDPKNDWYYKYSEYFPLFKYKYQTSIYPQTTVVSNFKELSELCE